MSISATGSCASSAGSQYRPVTGPPSTHAASCFSSDALSCPVARTSTSVPRFSRRSTSARPTPPLSGITMTRDPSPSSTPVDRQASSGGRHAANGTRRGICLAASTSPARTASAMRRDSASPACGSASPAPSTGLRSLTNCTAWFSVGKSLSWRSGSRGMP